MICRWILTVLILVPPAFFLSEHEIDNLLIAGNATSTGGDDACNDYVTPFCYVCDSLENPDCRESQDWIPRRRNSLKKKTMRTRQGDDDRPRMPFDWKEVYGPRLEKFKQRCPSNDGCTTHIYLNSDRIVRRCFDPKETPTNGWEYTFDKRNPKMRRRTKTISRLTCADWPYCNVDSAYYWPNGTVEALVSPHDDPELKLRSVKYYCYECDSIVEPECTGQDYVKVSRKTTEPVAHIVDWDGFKRGMAKYRHRCPVDTGCYFHGDHMTGRVTRGCRNITTHLPRHLLVKDRRQESTVFSTDEVCRESECNTRIFFFSPSGAFLDSDWQFNNKSTNRADTEQIKNELWDYQADAPVIEETLFQPHINLTSPRGLLGKTIGNIERDERRFERAVRQRSKKRRGRNFFPFFPIRKLSTVKSGVKKSRSCLVVTVIMFFFANAQF